MSLSLDVASAVRIPSSRVSVSINSARNTAVVTILPASNQGDVAASAIITQLQTQLKSSSSAFRKCASASLIIHS